MIARTDASLPYLDTVERLAYYGREDRENKSGHLKTPRIELVKQEDQSLNRGRP
jgi:hypothetical protein